MIVCPDDYDDASGPKTTQIVVVQALQCSALEEGAKSDPEECEYYLCVR